MRPTTTIFAAFESKGKPEFNQQLSGTVRDVILAASKWLLESHMGTHMKITFARSAAELAQHTSARVATESVEDLTAELMAMLDQDSLPLGGE